MTVSFDFLSVPIEIGNDRISVLCIENKNCFRKITRSFYNENLEENNIIFSENLTQLKSKGNIAFIYDYFDISFSSSLMKKLYDSISDFCFSEMPEERAAFERAVFAFLDEINRNYDFDFSYNSEIDIKSFFKSQNLKPDIECKEFTEALSDYILLVQKYSSVKCFVLLNPHTYFSAEELTAFYDDMLRRNIKLLVIEGNKNFEKSELESLIISDEDFCEIFEER